MERGSVTVAAMRNGITMTDQIEKPITLAEMEELVVKHQEEGIHKVRSRGQIEAANELRMVAYSDMAELLEKDAAGNLRIKDLTELPIEVTRSIKKIKVRRERSSKPREYDGDGKSDDPDTICELVEIELWDKMNALDKLMKHYGGYEMDNKQKVDPLQRSLDSLLTSISDAGLPKLVHDPYADDVVVERDPFDDYDEDEDSI